MLTSLALFKFLAGHLPGWMPCSWLAAGLDAAAGCCAWLVGWKAMANIPS